MTGLAMSLDLGWDRSGQMVHNLESISMQQGPPWRLRDFPRERLDDLMRTYPTSLSSGSRFHTDFLKALDRMALYRGFGEQALDADWYPPSLRYELQAQELEYAVMGALTGLMHREDPLREALSSLASDEHREAFHLVLVATGAVMKALMALQDAEGVISPSTVDVRSANAEAERRKAIQIVHQIVPSILKSLLGGV
jgi:hypothetical protein